MTPSTATPQTTLFCTLKLEALRTLIHIAPLCLHLETPTCSAASAVCLRRAWRTKEMIFGTCADDDGGDGMMVMMRMKMAADCC